MHHEVSLFKKKAKELWCRSLLFKRKSFVLGSKVSINNVKIAASAHMQLNCFKVNVKASYLL